jgi:glycosyltransferase involved in cell wall biosynthesis
MACELDAQLLTARGHQVVRYLRDNDEIREYGMAAKARFAAETVWSRRSRREITALIRREKPDVAHFHNFFPLISPSAFAACRDVGIPVVVTVANYRVACANAFLFRDGGVCEDCLHRTLKWPAVVHGCYHSSPAQSAVVAAMQGAHRLLGTWDRLVDAFIVLTEFSRAKLVEGGLPADRVFVRSNFADPDPGDRPAGEHGGYALAVGRLSTEKGSATLLDAFTKLPDVPLRIVGDGPLRAELEAAASPGIQFLGHLPRAEVLDLMRAARLLVFPSLSYEHFPLVFVEAFATGLPVVASAVGATNELVGASGLGLTFPPADPEALAARVRWAWEHPAEMAGMGRAARRTFEERYSAEPAYKRLMEIFTFATGSRRSSG